jgi:hypothetical protein
MPEWLQTAVRDGDEISLWTLILRLVLSFGLGAVVAGIYRWTHRRDEAPAPSFLTTLVLMTIVIAMSTQVIGDNVARAFSLVGALSIVRFRTVVQDTRDTAYVIFAVVVGMAAGAGHLAVAITGVASFVMRPQTFAWEARDNALLLTVRLGLGRDPNSFLPSLFAQYLESFDLRATSTTKQGNACDFTYQIQLRSDVSQSALIGALSLLEGVQSVELRRG